MKYLERDISALIAIVISGILLSAYGVQFIEHEEPCPLCMLQRLGMIGVAASMLLNIKFGVRMGHYGLALLSAIAGGTVALRQISLHVCPGFPAFGIPVLGLSLYTWSFIIFVCVVLAVAILLFLYKPQISDRPAPINLLSKFAFGLMLLIAVANIFTTFTQCGFGPCGE